MGTTQPTQRQAAAQSVAYAVTLTRDVLDRDELHELVAVAYDVDADTAADWARRFTAEPSVEGSLQWWSRAELLDLIDEARRPFVARRGDLGV